jgi:enhancing lycopene biosynthesis protein 2
MKRVAVILAGCGVHDGAEIHEAVLTLLALDRAGAEVVCAAPDIPQAYVFDHQRGKASKGETRNVRTESARIARGPVKDVAELNPSDFDAVIVPGGYGVVKNLSDFAFKGTEFSVNQDVADFLRKFHELRRPIGLLCIAPAIGAHLFGRDGFRYTIGTDQETAMALAPLGGKHVNCGVEDIVVDDELNIVTSPAYMLAHRITEAEEGITTAVKEVLARA